jgi:predicted nuclease with TOPRIM domain
MSTELTTALKSSPLLIRDYVKNLETENAKLQKTIAKLESNAISSKHKIAELKKELDKCFKKGHLIVNVNR